MLKQKIKKCSQFSKTKNCLRLLCSCTEKLRFSWKRRSQFGALKLTDFNAENLDFYLKCKFFDPCQLLLPLFSTNRQTMIVVFINSKKNQMLLPKNDKTRALPSKYSNFSKKYSVLSQQPIHCISYLFALKWLWLGQFLRQTSNSFCK